ncbi:PTS sugar transporter subunit IIA [Bifidobacterium aquikefiri]|uniref:PTS sugar transporter subunit IIA n=1 Tax=Bifidobacterium aquikefiri TaxID=1653207 RepID=UPI0039ED1EAA
MTDRLFDSSNINVIDDADTWQSALQEASEPLLASKAITQLYVNKMIENVQSNGPYMVLSDYFALMHARPGEGVNSMGMSLLVSRNPIDLEGKQVKIFLIMAAVDNSSHLKSLQQVTSIFMDRKAYETILNGNKNEIVALFKQKEAVA